ncbi:MAG: hypothetical protein ACI86H_000227 [bacterium]|jgi:hypothetical protein
MSISNIYVTAEKIYYHLPQSPSHSIDLLTLEIGSKSLFETLEIVTEELSGNRVNFILDHSYTQSRFFTLPAQNKAKIKQILAFELGNTLLEESGDFSFDFQFQKFNETSQICAYSLSNKLKNQFVQLQKDHQLEILHIYSLTNLMNALNVHNENLPKNGIFLDCYEASAKIFLYKNSFLSGFSEIHLPIHSENSNQQIQSLLNQRISSIQFEEDIDEVIFDTQLEDIMTYSSTNGVDLKSVPLVSNHQFLLDLNSAILNRTLKGVINLFKVENPIFVEVVKNKKSLVTSLGLTFILLLFYIFGVSYNIISESQKFSQVQNKYQQLIQENLPAGISKANALYILEEQAKKLRIRWKEQEKFSYRTYAKTTVFQQISSLKKDAKDLIVREIIINQKNIYFKGTVSSPVEFTKLLKSTKKMYKKTHLVKQRQTQDKQQKINFTFAIEKI